MEELIRNQIEIYERKKSSIGMNNALYQQRLQELQANVDDLHEKLSQCRSLIRKQHELIQRFREEDLPPEGIKKKKMKKKRN
jgi:predicted ribosome quality control (RQC) complex YloA/Tae2 family protein